MLDGGNRFCQGAIRRKNRILEPIRQKNPKLPLTGIFFEGILLP
jgi:hypothetical protein